MGKAGPARTPPSRSVTPVPGRVLAFPALAILCLLALLALVATADEGYPPDGVGAYLELSDSQAMHVTAQGDAVSVDLDCLWTGLPPAVSPVLTIDPIPDGWDYVVSRAIQTDAGFAVPLDGSVELTINISRETPPGTYYLEPRLDNPIGNGTLTSLPLLVQVTAYNLEMDLGYLPRSARPGERLEGEILIWATAPVTRDVPVRLDWVAEGWSVQFMRETVRLDKGTPTSVRFTITPPVWALPGDYTVILSVDISDPRCTGATMETQVAIGAHPALQLARLPPILEADLGGSVTTNVSVVNEGNVAHKVIMVSRTETTPLPQGWSLTYSNLPTSVPPFEERTFQVTLYLPDDPTLAKAGLTTVPLRILTGDTSQDLLFNLGVLVAEGHDLAITLADPDANGSGSRYEPMDSWRLETDLLVTDMGNQRGLRQVDIRADYSSPVQSVFFSPPYILLSTGMVQNVRMTVLLDSGAQAGSYPVSVIAFDGGGGQSQLELVGKVPGVSASLILTASTGYGQGLSSSPSSTQYGPAPTSIDLEGQVVYNGVDDVESAMVVFTYIDAEDTEGTKEILGMVPLENLSTGDTRSFTANFDALEAGDWVFEAHLEVPGASQFAADTGAEASLTAVPKDPDDT